MVVQALRDAGYADGGLAASPVATGWEHINLAGDYSWRRRKQVEQGDFRSLTVAQSTPWRTIFPFREVTSKTEGNGR